MTRLARRSFSESVFYRAWTDDRIFTARDSVTATIKKSSGSDDVDFHSFLLSGGDHFTVPFDIDNDPFVSDAILSLFDSTGTLILFFDDDSSSEESWDGIFL